LKEYATLDFRFGFADCVRRRRDLGGVDLFEQPKKKKKKKNLSLGR
jgi:hypothetical protein